jgi:hypothetical protein
MVKLSRSLLLMARPSPHTPAVEVTGLLAAAGLKALLAAEVQARLAAEVKVLLHPILIDRSAAIVSPLLELAQEILMLRRLTIAFACFTAPLLFSATFAAEPARPAGAVVQAPAKASLPAPRKDMTGKWSVVGFAGAGVGGTTPSPFTALGQQLMDANKPGDGPRKVNFINLINDPHTMHCDPEGFPRMLLFELRPFQVLQSPDEIHILYSYDQRWRTIRMDGRPLPQSGDDPRWYGHSVGKWADDSTLVIESNSTMDSTWLDLAGNPHSADLRVTETYHRVDADTLELTVEINDPAVYTAPWKARNKLKISRLPADTVLQEMVCVSSDAMNYQKVMSTTPP